MAFEPSQEEMAEMQKLSNDYEPEVTGPLVSELLPSSAITTEYANADPVYQRKTAALPHKYSHYRTCRGDGHCGWRAVAFSYYEALYNTGNKSKFYSEEARLRSLGNLLNQVGFPEHLYEDFAIEAFQLLQETAVAMENNDGGAKLLAAFNDESLSMSIITYLKLLTSAYIQTHPDEYSPYMNHGQSVQNYCQSSIEPVMSEIEHVGMSALVEVLVKPAGMAMEILYLDRSQGEEVNTYRWDPVDGTGITVSDPSTLRLLYRPGHYDILYKMEPLPQSAIAQPQQQPPVFVALANAIDSHIPQTIGFSDYAIPGLSFVSPPSLGWSSMTTSTPLYPSAQSPCYDFAPTATPIAAIPAPAPSSNLVSMPQHHANSSGSSAEVGSHVHTHGHSEIHADLNAHGSTHTHALAHSQSHSSHPHTTTYAHTPATMALPPDFLVSGMQPEIPQTPPVGLSLGTPSGLAIDRGGPFRPSAWELKPNFSAAGLGGVPLQTAIFRNSHYNTAHFNNPDFQPEEWSPETELPVHERPRKKSAH
ncbi:cysteine proteinase [Eremomyces bilateralis CBS 781.70]|uniref:ubiquitinyl hydrolase 1 n=1 Tax=Eremomyces bilateralis CBS 781.70 TaxID=1392243 RepID=A0A6G1FZR9_9PEZI|nr:cysteine proteinase [Eremomyces bilateralis CBS 781.70]KAF1811059.1 cysteine proteinase [Eremomyces bilateralis CBS 781.70]